MARPEAPFSYIFASELHGRLVWFARLRWIAVAALTVTALVGPRLGWPGVWPSLLVVAGFVAAYNLVFLQRLRGVQLWETRYGSLRAAAIQHMLADLGSLLAVVHFTGGCHSPALPFVAFHMAIGTIMISTRVMYLLAALTSASAITLFALEATGVLRGYWAGRPEGAVTPSCFVGAAVLVVLVFGMVYLTDTVTSRFKHRGIQLFEASEKLRERKEQLQKLLREREEVERRKSHYMRISAHQLRSPLGTIQTSLKVLLDGIIDPASAAGRQMIAGASERVDDLLSIVNDLLELAKMREGRARATWVRDVSVNQVLADILDAIAPYAQERGVELVSDVDGAAILRWGVPPDLVYAFENLIQNAIKYSNRGGEVRVGLRVEGRVAAVAVSDRGIGIPEALLEDVFLEFVRAPNAKKHDRAGTGLGLSIVREGIEKHGGSVAVASTVGSGTTFTVRLPLDHVPREVGDRAEVDAVAG